MICQYCKETRHTLCRGRLWCDCQHRGSQPPDEEAQAALIELTQLAQEDRLGDYGPVPGHVCSRECNHDGPGV